MYDLVAKIPDGLVELKRLLEIYIYNQGMEAIEKCCDAAINVRKYFVLIIKGSSFKKIECFWNRDVKKLKLTGSNYHTPL